MEPLSEIVVSWCNLKFCIKVDGGNTIADIKNKIFKRTGVEPASQKLENLTCSEDDPDQSVCLRDMNIKNNFVLIMTEMPAKELPGSSETASQGVVLQQSAGDPPGAIWWPDPSRRPRKGAYLVILDVDKTIYDAKSLAAGHKPYAPRPYLQYFLEKVYTKYEIIIWSATNLQVLYKKIDFMGMLRSEKYKILCCLGESCMVKIPGKEKKTKSLTTIWNRYPEFTAKNTIICDDQSINLYGNKQNGVQVLPYSYKNVVTDNELLFLASYLHYAASFDDVSKLQHAKWKECIDTVS